MGAKISPIEKEWNDLIKKENKFYKLSKEDLIDFCIKLIKVIEDV